MLLANILYTPVCLHWCLNMRDIQTHREHVLAYERKASFISLKYKINLFVRGLLDVTSLQLWRNWVAQIYEASSQSFVFNNDTFSVGLLCLFASIFNFWVIETVWHFWTTFLSVYQGVCQQLHNINHIKFYNQGFILSTALNSNKTYIT